MYRRLYVWVSGSGKSINRKILFPRCVLNLQASSMPVNFTLFIPDLSFFSGMRFIDEIYIFR